MRKGTMRSNCYGEFSHNNPARRRDAIRRVKRDYEKSPRGKRVREHNYIAKLSFLLNVKAQIGCEDCRESDPVVLVFHHRNPSNMKFRLAGDCTSRSWGAIVKEIEKCDVVCANCHMRRHNGCWHELNGESIIYEKENKKIESQLYLRGFKK